MENRIYIYQSSPNQRHVITRKAESDKEHIYSIVNIEAVSTAARSLSDRAFKLYSRLNLHQDGHTYALSPREIEHSFGIGDKRYREAVRELIREGYLVESPTQKNVFEFWELPESRQTITDNAHAGIDTPSETGSMTRQNGQYAPAILDGYPGETDGYPGETDGYPGETDGYPGETDGYPGDFGKVNPAESGGEIIHNITSHNTKNNTENITVNITKDNIVEVVEQVKATREYIDSLPHSFQQALFLQSAKGQEYTRLLAELNNNCPWWIRDLRGMENHLFCLPRHEKEKFLDSPAGALYRHLQKTQIDDTDDDTVFDLPF